MFLIMEHVRGGDKSLETSTDNANNVKKNQDNPKKGKKKKKKSLNQWNQNILKASSKKKDSVSIGF